MGTVRTKTKWRQQRETRAQWFSLVASFAREGVGDVLAFASKGREKRGIEGGM